MEERELLQAIGEIMDQKIEPIHQDISELKTDVSELKADVSGLKTDVSGLKTDVSGLKTDVSELKTGQETLRQDVSELKAGQESLEEQIIKINIKLENDIGRKISTLFDAHQLDSEKIDHILETVEAMNNAYAATDVITRVNTAEINKLKAKIG